MIFNTSRLRGAASCVDANSVNPNLRVFQFNGQSGWRVHEPDSGTYHSAFPEKEFDKALVRMRYVAGPDQCNQYVFVNGCNGNFGLISIMDIQCWYIDPVAWVHNSVDDKTLIPVYSGDCVYHKELGLCTIIPTINDIPILMNKITGAYEKIKYFGNDQVTLAPPPFVVEHHQWLNMYWYSDSSTYSAACSVAYKTKEDAERHKLPDIPTRRWVCAVHIEFKDNQ